ncbi:MAG: hypothetical protein L7F78_17185, partial [Syntrophales bacterium LBB04]|nr:hypothetical protein [Syntrophales bacterium LBB04]
VNPRRNAKLDRFWPAGVFGIRRGATGRCPEPKVNRHPRRYSIGTEFEQTIGGGTFPPGNERCSQELRASVLESREFGLIW